MTIQIGIKLEPGVLKRIKNFAKEYGTSVSALMRQATLEYIKQRTSEVYTSSQSKGTL